MIYKINKSLLLETSNSSTVTNPSTAAANVFKKFNRNDDQLKPEENTASHITEAVHINHPYLNKQSAGNQGYSTDEIRFNRKKLARSISDERQDGRIERRMEHSKIVKDPALQAEAGAAANVHYNNARSMSASGGIPIDAASNMHKGVHDIAKTHAAVNGASINLTKVNTKLPLKQALGHNPRLIPSAKR